MRRFIKPALIAALILTAGIFVRGSITPPSIGGWLSAASMSEARSSARSALLEDGRILITGGDNGSGPVASAEFFDTTGSFVTAPPMGMAREAHSATVLADGRILVAGGSTGAAATNSAEIFDPAANSWTAVAGGMIQARSNHTASLLGDGRVLFAGGDNAGAPVAVLEIFDPVAGSFSSVGVMSTPRMSFASVILSDGRVLLIGGSNGTVPLATTEIFDPTSNSISAGPAISAPRMGHSATTLLDGKVLVVGGNNGSADVASAEIYDPATGNFAVSASSLAAPRRDHAAFLLPNNNSVLIVGGTSAGAEVTTAEMFLPSTETFAATGSPTAARQHATGTALSQDGILFLAGGSNSTGTLATSELYGFATLKTDKADYAPGEIVAITGSGWQPGETVTLTLVESPFYDSHGPFTTVADSAGRISNTQFSPDEHDIDIRFHLSAVGSLSGIQAQNTFRDSKPNTVTVGTQAPNPVAPGVSATYTVTVNFNGNGNSCTSPLSIQPPPSLPTGATANFAPSSLTSTGGNATSTLTISTTNATPPGLTTFTVLAANGGGTCQSGTATGTGTLVIVENTTTALTSSVNPSVFGQSTTLTATVAQTVGTTVPTGTVTFKDGATTLGTGTLNGSGQATLAVSTLTAGSHNLTASYAGVANTFGASTSNTVTQTVNQASTTTTLARTSGTSPSVFGQSLTFTATVAAVAPGAGTATGNVTFKDGATTLATITLTGNTAALTTTTLAVGAHSITATYNADANFTGSTSGSVSQTVNQAATTTAISSHTPNPSVVGQSVTVNFSVTPVSPGGGTPTGNVTVSDGLGDTCTATVAAGTCSITFPAAGSKTLSAVYAGDTNFTGSTSANAPHTVNPAATTTTITNSVALGTASIVNQPYAVNYSVAITSPGGGTIPPTDTVTVTDGTDSCTGTVAAATCNLTSTTTGSKTITAKYNGNANYSISTSAGVPHTVGIAPTISSANNTAFTVNSAGTFTVTATGSPTPTLSETGALPSGVTFNAATGVLSGSPALGTVNTYNITITASNGIGTNATQNFTLTVNKLTPTFANLSASQTIPFGRASIGLSGRVNGFAMMPGTVSINIGGVNSPALTLNGNQNNFSIANFDTHTLPVSGSPYTITYTYSGDADSNSASDTSTLLTVTKVTPTANWATPAAITYNTALGATQLNATFTAVVNGVTVPVAGTPTYNPAAGTVLNAGAGQTLAVSFVPTDTTDYNNANASVLITVNKAATSTAVTSNNNPSFSGQSVTFTATVSNTSGTSGVPTGSVQFMDGVSTLGSPQLLSAGHATLTTSALSVATHSITAVYTNSDGNFTGSTSSALSQVVKSADTTTTISAPTITYGANGGVTVTVAAVDPSAGTPTGNVTLSVDGGGAVSQALVNGSTTFTVSNPNAGDHSLSASYAAQNNFNASSATGNLHVNQAQATLAFGTLTFFYDGSAKPVSVTTTPLGLGVVSVTYNGSPTPPTNAGSYTVEASLNNANYVATPISGTEVIQQAQATVTFGQLTFAYDGTPKSATVTTNPLGLTVNITYSQNNNPVVSPTAAGSYAVSASIVDANYQGSATGTLVISKANLYVIPSDQTRNFSDANPSVFPATYAGFASGDNAGNSVSGTLTCQIAATPSSPAGHYAIHGCSGLSSANYNLVYANGTLTITNPLVSLAVTPATPTIHIGETQPFVAVGTFQQGSRNLGAASGVWGSASSMPTARAGAAAAEVNGHLYVISGTGDGSSLTDSVDVYNPVAGTWASPSSVNPITTNRVFARAVALGGQLYVVGGCTVVDCSSGITGALEVYDPGTNSWIAKASMPSGTERFDAAVGVVNGKLYVAGGHNASSVVGTVEIYNPATDTWTSGQSMTTARSAAAAGVMNGLLYVAGGSTGGGPVNTLEAYDPAQDSWTTLTPSPAMAAQSFAGGAVLNGMLYAVSGIDGGSNPTTTVQAYDPVANSWTNQTSISTGLYDGQPVAIGGLMYAAGNGPGNTPATTLQVFSPNEVGWNSATPSVATIDATGLATGVAAGTSTITGTSVPFPSVSGTAVLTVIKKVQTITFGALGDKTYGDADFTVSATSDSGLTVTFLAAGNCTVSGTTVHITGAGSCTITAQQAGNDTFSAAPDVPQTFSIAKAHLTVKADDKSKTYDGAVFSPFTATITGFVNGENSGVVGGAPSFTGTAVTAVNAGSYTITPTVGSLTATNYDFTIFTDGTLLIKQATPTVAVSFALSPVTYDGDPHAAIVTVTGVAAADLAGHGTIVVTYTPGGTTAPLNAGSYSASAHFTSTDSNYTDADSTVPGTLVIKKANAVITVTPYSVTYDAVAHTATGGAMGVKNESLAGLNLAGTTHTSAGDYPNDAWTFTDVTGNYYNAGGTVHDHIEKANATIVVAPYGVTYDGNAHTATGTAKGVLGEILSGLDLSATTHTDAGDYSTDPWTFVDVTGNYKDTSGTVHDTIAKADPVMMAVGGTFNYDGNPHAGSGTALGVNSQSLTPVNLAYSTSPAPGNLLTSAPVNAGSYLVAARFAGNNNYNQKQSATVALVINQVPLTITASSGSMIYGGSPFVVTPIPNGFVNGEGFNNLTTQPICLPIFTSSTPSGTYISTCTGAVGANYAISSFVGSVTVSPASTSTTVVSSPNPSDWSQVVTLTATVANTSTGAAPTGLVSFYNAASGASCLSLGTSTLIDNAPLSATNPYQASTTIPTLPVGANTILACYNYNSGDPTFNANFIPSYGTTSQTVNAAPIATLTPTSLSFGNQQGGTTSGAKTVTLCNGPSGASTSPCFTAPVATAPLTISSIGFSGTNSSYFTQTNNCPTSTSLGVGGSCTINVKFAPPVNSSGVATALLNVNDDSGHVGGSATQSSSITGAGVSSINSVGSLSTYAIFATANGCSSVNMSGNALVDSFNSGSGNNNNGNVGTNGNATLSGNSVLNGAVYSPVAGTGNCSSKSLTGLSTSGKAQATGGLQGLSGPVSYPAPPAPNPAPPTTTQSISGSCGSISGCTNSGTKNVILAPGQYGNLSASGGTTLHVSKGTYNLNSLTLSGNSTLVVDSVPVVVNIAGKSISGGNAVLDLSGGVMSNATGMASNLQFYYAGFQPIKLTGGTGSYAVVYAPNAPINISGGSHFYGAMVGSTVNNSGGTAIHYDASLPSIQAGNFIWFNSAALNVQGLPASGTVKMYVTNSTISFTANGTPYNLAVPNSVITFSSTATSTSTTWDATNNRWSVLVPTPMASGSATIHTFLDGLAFLVPSGGFPTGIQNVTWSAAFSTTTTGLNFNWQWGAAVYSTFPANTTGSAFPPTTAGDYNLAGVNPVDGADPAGTPLNNKSSLVLGATGAGYIGLYTGTAGVVPTIAEASASPSSLDFGNVTVLTTSSPLTSVLTNNMSGQLTISSVQITGTNAGDFAQTNNCPITPSTLASGATCTISVTFKPTATGKRTAKIAVTDSANNSPQTVFLKGTGQ